MSEHSVEKTTITQGFDQARVQQQSETQTETVTTTTTYDSGWLSIFAALTGGGATGLLILAELIKSKAVAGESLQTAFDKLGTMEQIVVVAPALLVACLSSRLADRLLGDKHVEIIKTLEKDQPDGPAADRT